MDGSLIRNGLGLNNDENNRYVYSNAETTEENSEGYPDTRSLGEYILPLDPSNPEGNERIARAFAEEARLHQELRAAGLL